MKPIETCIITAAGRGSRWAPVSGYLPKEMLPLVNRPVIELVIDEVKSAGCEEIIVVINKQKEVIKNYLFHNSSLNKKVKIHYVYQDKPLGIAHAILQCQEIIGGNPFAVALPDLPAICKTPAMKQLISGFNKTNGNSHIISFDKFPSKTAHLYGECLLKLRSDNLFEVIHFCPKNTSNKPHHGESNLRMSGRFIFKNNIFSIITKLLSESTELEITDRLALNEALKKHDSLIGVEIQGHTYDTGTPTGYVQANTAFFKRTLRKL